jgi:pilus assembly protein FimV
MSRLLCPILLLASATFPSAALALGLGELHVESALGQNFVAHIDLIDASAEDLGRLQAALADEDTFQRKQLERPNFLAGMTISVGQDARGQPILLLRSMDSFTEPVVTFLVDVHWRAGELIREYTALLDPSELASKAPDASAEPGAPPMSAPAAPMTPVAAAGAPPNAPAPPMRAPPTQVTQPAHSTPTQRVAKVPDPKPQLRSHKIARGDTLVRIATLAGARSRKERLRMMIAIYRANPSEFQNGLNTLLHRGAMLRLPTAEELAAISPAEADREYRAASHETAPRKLHANSSEHAAGTIESKADAAALETDKLALRHRVESLEQSLQEVRQELQERVQQTNTPPPQVRAEQTDTPPLPVRAEQANATPLHQRAWFIALISGLGLLLAAGAWWVRRRRRNDDSSTVVHAIVADEPTTALPADAVSAEPLAGEPAAIVPEPSPPIDGSMPAQADTHDVNPPLASADTAPEQPDGQVDTGDTTAVLAPEIEDSGDTAEHKFSFYNPDNHLDTTHVVMGSELTRPLAFVERRKNPAIVLQQAIEREPHRSDLHLKLLELYYASASENRLAFLEAARQIMHRQDLVSAEDWARIAAMGRQIAPDEELFRSELDDQAVA